MHWIVVYAALLVCCMVLSATCSVVVSVDWGNVTQVSNTYATLQVVTNPLYERTSPMHDSTFKALADINLEYVRFQGWFPYPQLVVAELQPPTGNPVCASVAAEQLLYLSCYEGVFSSIDFAAFGISGGRCGNFSHGACHSNVSLQIVEKYCLGQSSCLFNASAAMFLPEGPCSAETNRLSVQATCSVSVFKTFWNFTLLDPFLEDFMEATQNRSMILNFCATPEWLWNTGGPVVIPDDPNEVVWDYHLGTDLRDASMQDLTSYYSRLFQWYTHGGFTDEYGVYHNSGHYYFIPFFEIFNEMNLIGFTVEQYTPMYDAIATVIKKLSPKTQIVGMAVGGDLGSHYNWFQYFLNSSNHDPNAPPLEWISYHFYATPDSRNDTQVFEQNFFGSADYLFETVAVIESIRKQLAPQVKTTMDEVGVILPNDLVDNPDPIPDIYWNAAGAMFAYIYGGIIKYGIEVLGESQMIGFPTQYPSVSMMDWVTGKPNSRYWVLYLLHQSFEVGDQLVSTTSSNSTAIYAQGFVTSKGKAILIVNKTNLKQIVTVQGMESGQMAYVDLTTYEGPPATVSLSNSTFALNPFAVAVVSP